MKKTNTMQIIWRERRVADENLKKSSVDVQVEIDSIGFV